MDSNLLNEDINLYNHVQPFDSKFVLDILTDEITGNDDFRFVTWSDFDKALDVDSELKKKLTRIAKEKEVEDLRKLVYKTSNAENNIDAAFDNASVGKFYQKFVPYGNDFAKNNKYQNMENEVYFYNKDNK